MIEYRTEADEGVEMISGSGSAIPLVAQGWVHGKE